MPKVFIIDLGATSAKCAFFENEKVIKTFVYKIADKTNLLENIAKKNFWSCKRK